jgi:hypothetical protein
MQVTGADRSAIILPTSALEQFYETIGYFLEASKSQGGASSSGTRARPVRNWNDG